MIETLGDHGPKGLSLVEGMSYPHSGIKTSQCERVEDRMVEFGCVLPQESSEYITVKRTALECERLGFDSIWLYDHVFPFWRKPSEPILECLTTLSALASETKTVRLGTIVLSNTFRYPSILAKMAATLDVISNGRLEFGIGAGVSEHEHHAYGIPFQDPSVRIERLREAVHIIETMWVHGECSYKGKYCLG